jgi:hypothetical protein
MTPTDLLRHRLHNQHLTNTPLTQPEAPVTRLVAMQAQVWDMAKWAIGLRVPGATDASVEAAFNEGRILRTHVLRPTWHFISPADLRWLLGLSGPRVTAFNAPMARKLGLDRPLFNRSNDVLAKALEGGNFLTRAQLQAALADAGIQVAGQHLAYVVMQAELDGVLCSGPRLGRQFSYALLAERVPTTPTLTRDEAFAELTRRYFATRGPATLADFAWWSGLTMSDVRRGVSMLPEEFEQRDVAGQTCVFLPGELPHVSLEQTTFLMPDYDEYGIAYKNRNVLFGDAHLARAGNGTMPHAVVMGGVVAGTWQRADEGKRVGIKTRMFRPLDANAQAALENAVERYQDFFKIKPPSR